MSSPETDADQPNGDSTVTAPTGDEAASGDVVSSDADLDAGTGTPAAELGARLHDRIEAEAAEAEADVDPRDELGLEAVPASIREATDGTYGPCPFCDGYGAVRPEQLLEALPEIVKRLEPYKQSARYETCPGCDGWGAILTGSRRPDSGVQPCPDCDGQGFVAANVAAQLRGEQGAGTGDEPAPIVIGGDALTLPPPAGSPPAPGMVWDAQAGSWIYPAAPAAA